MFTLFREVQHLFGLKLAHILFGATEQVSLLLQRKDIAIQEALSGVDTAKAYFKRLRSEEEFERFYDASVQVAQQFSISQPVLPRRRRCCTSRVHFTEGLLSSHVLCNC